ncbi:MAG: hypothetical protein ACJA0P_000189 [Planctomycetota bacterium]|jgi:hypothetical protein
MLHLVTLALVSSQLIAAAPAEDPPEGFRALFDGKSLDGWWGASTEDPRVYLALPPEELAAKKAESQKDVHAHWSIEDGVLVNDGHGLFLTTDDNYGDFELRLEYRTVALADSGIYLRGCPQVQIWDTTKAGGKWNIGADKGSGGLWNNSPGAPGKDPLVHADKPFGEWNGLRVQMVGERVSVWLNDQLVVEHARLENYYDRARPAPREGPIQLQTHGGEIRWRNVWLHEIDATEANAILRAPKLGGAKKPARDTEFVEIFNGKDLSGWSGPLDGYQVEDGALLCKPGNGGTIFWDHELGDFEVELEINLPPGGNNGLALRYPGQGDTAYTGMCELQVIDSSAAKYAGLEPRQHHGSVYGQVAAERGYLRAPGSWNFQRVTVKGPWITVELNGTRILHADTSKVTDFMYAAEKFAGRGRERGFFGLAGHNDPVRFRHLRIREL